jgi:hypothetical protein
MTPSKDEQVSTAIKQFVANIMERNVESIVVLAAYRSEDGVTSSCVAGAGNKYAQMGLIHEAGVRMNKEIADSWVKEEEA